MSFVQKTSTAKSAAERMKLYRLRMTEEKKKLVREKNKEAKRLERLNYSEKRKNEERELAKLRMRTIRKKEVQLNKDNSSPIYGSTQALGKAARRVSDALPKSPRKKAAVLKHLVVKFNVSQNSHKKPENGNSTELEEKIISFYNEDSISRQLPGKKDCITMKVDGRKEKVQKKILLMTVLEAFHQFKSEHPEIKVGKSKFASLRPKNILPVSEKDHNVCCCIYHENFELLVCSIKKFLPLLPNPEDLIKAVVCSPDKKCYMGDCDICSNIPPMLEQYFPENLDGTTEIEYTKWEADKKVVVKDRLSLLKDILYEQVTSMKKHTYIAKIQLTQIKKFKLNLNCNEVIIHEDFSENYNLKQQNEIMTAHWNSQGVTLFTAVVNLKDTSYSYALVSDELHHDKYAVAAFNRLLGKCICERYPDVTKVHMFSDGAASQFKNRFNLSNLFRPELIHPNIVEVDWSFFAMAHGKGPVDGVGGTVKRSVWRRVFRNEAVINTAEEFANVAKQSCPNIEVLYVSSSDIEIERIKLEKIWEGQLPKAIPNIRNFHFFKVKNSYQLEIQDVSPFLHSVIPFCKTVSIFNEPKALQYGNDLNNGVKIFTDMYYAVDHIDRFYIGRILGCGY